MGNGCMKENKNVYFRARKSAAIHNEKLSSRKGAAELLGVSVSTLSDYELGITKYVPVDKVVMMADLYNCPEFKNGYCKNECPIGKSMPIATQVKGIEGVVLKFIHEFDSEKIGEIVKSLVEITSNGNIEEDNKQGLEMIIKRVDELAIVLSELKLISEKILKG